MILRKITLALFTGLLSTSPCRAMEPGAPKENKADITVPQKLSFKEKAAQVKATMATFMLNHKKTLIKGTIITTTVILGAMLHIGYGHYQRLKQEPQKNSPQSNVNALDEWNEKKKQEYITNLEQNAKNNTFRPSILGDASQCAICLETKVNFVLLCQHAFHISCIQNMCYEAKQTEIKARLKNRGSCFKAQCPTCRAQLQLTSTLDIAGTYFQED
jgi:hypothetical protein